MIGCAVMAVNADMYSNRDAGIRMRLVPCGRCCIHCTEDWDCSPSLISGSQWHMQPHC